jgi:putative protease
METQINAAFGICQEAGVRFVCKSPKILKDTSHAAFLSVIPRLVRMGIHEYMAENYGTVYALMHTDPKVCLFGAAGLNIFNHLSAQALSSVGLLTLSPELSRDEIRVLIASARSRGLVTQFALIVQGNSEAMISEDCILQPWLQCIRKEYPGTSAFSGVMDASGHLFPVRIDGECRSHIYNAAEICLIDHLPSLIEIGVSEVVIDARDRTGAYAAEMTQVYRQAVSLAKEGIRHDDPRIDALKDAVRRRSLGGITSGHFIRGLKEPLVLQS